jgi:hypothetical protein
MAEKLSERIHRLEGHRLIPPPRKRFLILYGTETVAEKAYFKCVLANFMNRGSVVGTVTSYGLDDRGVRVRVSLGPRI